jgi:Leucine-rich repeat (LRR) protein
MEPPPSENSNNFASWISVLPTITIVNSKIGDEGVKHLASLPHLTTLNLSIKYLYSDKCEIGRVGANYIGKIASLRTLHLNFNNVGDDGTKHIGNLHGLNVLNMSNKKE